MKLKTRVTSVDIKGKSLEAEAPGPRRHHITWDYLVVATGAKVCRQGQGSGLRVYGKSRLRQRRRGRADTTSPGTTSLSPPGPRCAATCKCTSWGSLSTQGAMCGVYAGATLQ